MTEARKPRDRARTEAALRSAALELIRERGPLQELNLNEVAKRADVNRVQIYHYYGDKNTLLRAAIREQLDKNRPDRARLRELPFTDRRVGMFDHFIQRPDIVKLEALLAIDGDEQLSVFIEFEEGLKSLLKDVDDGVLDPQDDLIAKHILTASAYLGYVLFRETFSRDVSVPIQELDERLRAEYVRVVNNMTAEVEKRD